MLYMSYKKMACVISDNILKCIVQHVILEVFNINIMLLYYKLIS